MTWLCPVLNHSTTAKFTAKLHYPAHENWELNSFLFLHIFSWTHCMGEATEKQVIESFSDSVTCKALGLPYLEIKNPQEKHRSHLLWLCKYLAYINLNPHCWLNCLPSKCYDVFSDLNCKILGEWNISYFGLTEHLVPRGPSPRATKTQIASWTLLLGTWFIAVVLIQAGAEDTQSKTRWQL